MSYDIDHETALALARAVRRQIHTLREFPRRNAAELAVLRTALVQIERSLSRDERLAANSVAQLGGE